jgi:hypothetical protein
VLQTRKVIVAVQAIARRTAGDRVAFVTFIDS